MGLLVIGATLMETTQSDMVRIAIAVEASIALVVAHKMTAPGTFVIALETHAMTAQGAITRETAIKMAVGGHYPVVLTVESPISTTPMSWPIL